MEKELKAYMHRLSLDFPDRFIGNKGHRVASSYLEKLLHSWGLWVKVHPFTVDITLPQKWSLEIDTGRGFERVDTLPGIGAPTVNKLEADIQYVGHAREEDYASLNECEGKVHLAKLWKNHETAKVREAALNGARALIWYNDYFDELYSGACDYSLAPIPGISVKKSVAKKVLERGGGRVRLWIKSRRRKIRCRNIESGRGPASGRHAILTAHYDSRPQTPGASDDASGIAVMLAFIRSGGDADLPFGIRYFFADCEEEGCVGAEHYAARLYRTNLLKEISCLVNLDAVGWPNLCVITRDRETVLDEGLAHLASDVLDGMGYQIERVRSKTGKSNHTPFAVRGVPSLWLSDYPNHIRHSAMDNVFNIDYPTMIMVTNALRDIFRGVS
ncbi:M28 family peptidase [bacterium]|nr:MAG: M28 family peptidase [bacterium]